MMPRYEWLGWTEATSVRGRALRVQIGSRYVDGRLESVGFDTMVLLTRSRDAVEVTRGEFARARVIGSLFGPGDPVLLVGRPFEDWRGGVVAVDGARVLVETMDGATVWLAEDVLDHADDRMPTAVPLPPGPVPSAVAEATREAGRE